MDEFKVVAVFPPRTGKRHEAMVAAYYACEKAGIDMPQEIDEYFDFDGPKEERAKEISIPFNQSKGSYGKAVSFQVKHIPIGAESVKVTFY